MSLESHVNVYFKILLKEIVFQENEILEFTTPKYSAVKRN